MSRIKKSDDRLLGIAVVAGLFGVVGAGAITVTYDYGFAGAIGLFLLIAAIVFVVLWFGWQDPAPIERGKRAPKAGDMSISAAPAPTVARSSETADGGSDTSPGEHVGAAAAAATVAASAAAQDAVETVESAAASVADTASSVADTASTAVETAASEVETAASEIAEAVDEAPVDPGTRPEALDGPRDGKADDLKQIKGVGPALEKLCHKLGFYHFDQIAAWTDSEVAWVDQNLEGFKGRVTRDEWVPQAKILASGGTTEFAQKVDKGDVTY